MDLPPPPPQTWRFPSDEAPPARQFLRSTRHRLGRAALAVPRVAGAIAFRTLVALIIMLAVAIPLLYLAWRIMLYAAGN
jgi:hypothetical protein